MSTSSRRRGVWSSPTDAALASRGTLSGEGVSRLHLVGTSITAAVAVLCPLPFGSVENVWASVWCLPLAAALVLFSLRRLRPSHVGMLATVLVVAAAIGGVVVLQTVPNAAFAPPHATWSTAEQLLGRPLAATVSLDADQSWAAFGRPILLLLAFCCAFLAAVERRCATLLFAAIGYSGAAYALYGIVALVADPGHILGYDKYAYVGDLTATFVNRNTAGTFFGMSLILWWIRLLSELDSRAPKSAAGVRDYGAILLDSPSRAMVIALVGTTLTFAALLLTRSRAGILLSLGSLVVVSTLYLRHRMSGRVGSIGVVAGLVIMGAFLLELLGGAVAGRFGSDGLVDAGRLSAYRSSLAILRDNFWFGTGLGSFKDIFPAYREPATTTTGLWDRAHSTPLEIAVELGAGVAVAVVALWLAGLLKLLAGGLSRRRDTHFAITAFGVGLLGSLHALVDFSPQVPGFAVPWLMLIGVGLAQSVRTDAARSGRPAPAGMALQPSREPVPA